MFLKDSELLYTIRYMARTGRGDWPWSSRRVGIYYTLDGDNATWLILQHSSFAHSVPALKFGDGASCNELTKLSPIAQHVAFMESTSRPWNDYLKFLEAQIRKDVSLFLLCHPIPHSCLRLRTLIVYHPEEPGCSSTCIHEWWHKY